MFSSVACTHAFIHPYYLIRMLHRSDIKTQAGKYIFQIGSVGIVATTLGGKPTCRVPGGPSVITTMGRCSFFAEAWVKRRFLKTFWRAKASSETGISRKVLAKSVALFCRKSTSLLIASIRVLKLEFNASNEAALRAYYVDHDYHHVRLIFDC